MGTRAHPSPLMRKRRLIAVSSAALAITAASLLLKHERRTNVTARVSSVCTDFFGECISDPGGAKGVMRGMMGREDIWRDITSERCASYSPLFGGNSKYAFEDPSCAWVQGDGKSAACQYYCYYDDRYGVARINHELWQAAQRGEADIWANAGDADNDRSKEILEGFQGYANVTTELPLGKLLEVGSGPFTQTKALIDQLRRKSVDPDIEAVALVDPGIDGYMTNTKHCAYKNHTLSGYPVTTQSVGGEQMVLEPGSFDTVISINVLEHCEDAFEYLRRMDRALRPGGLLIFHDRVYDGFWKTVHPVKDSKEIAGLHPLRVKQRVIDQMVENRYDIIMRSTKLTGAMEERKANQITEEPLWLIARKKT